MRICIATGIYPPATSGPAQYAAAMEREFAARGHKVDVVTYTIENKLPTGIRHLVYFFRALPKVCSADFVLALDTFSVGLPAAIASRICGRKIIIRTGGDFLYEQFVERTNEKVLLSKFYLETRKFSMKERFVFKLTRWTLKKVSAVVFSTEWQRNIFFQPYQLNGQKIFVVENRFDNKISDEPAQKKNFIFATRNIAYKNIEAFKSAFAAAQKNNPDISLEIYHTLPHEELMEKIKTCYAVVMPSLGEISPHLILDALRCNKPFLLSKESGYAEKLKNVGVLVDPLDESDMTKKVLEISDDKTYFEACERVRSFDFVHSWGQIADELLLIFAKI